MAKGKGPSNRGEDSDAGNKQRTLNKKQLKKKVDTVTSFRITFTGTPQARTTSVSSGELLLAQKGLRPALAKNGVRDVEALKGKIISYITLDTVRGCGKLPNSRVFCIDDANTVPDATSLADYILMIGDNIIPLSGDVSTGLILTVRYTSRHRRPDKIPPPPTLPSAGKDDSKAAEVENKLPKGVNIDTAGLVAESGGIVSTHPAELNEQEWNYVMVTNSLLHGMFFDKTSFSLQKARQPAFKLKQSVPDRFFRPASEPEATTTVTLPEKFHIPAFEVNDESFVKITEVKSTLQLSMAQQGFSSWSAELSASGGIGAYSGGVSASASSSSSTSSASNHGEVKDCLHASYNFPRVKVFLDAEDLEVSDDCKVLLQKINDEKNPEDVTKFYKKYGHIFSSCVQLGGRLHATKESDTSSDVKAKAAKSEFKAAVGANFSAPFVSGSASAAHANSHGSQSGETNEKSSESLSWEAQGGETLLGSNPAAWVTTVGSFYNWRVIVRSNTNSILALLRDVDASKRDWPAIFSNIGNVLARLPDRPGQADNVIQIKNDGSSWIQVAISSKFFAIPPGKSNIWVGSGKSSVCINGGGSGRVAIAIAEPGIYKIQELDYVDPNIEYVSSADFDGHIGVTNNLATTIQVKVTDNSNQGARDFFDVAPSATAKWGRTHSETIFVKHPASFALLTYLGVSGQELRINGLSDSPPSILHFGSNSNQNQIKVVNELGKKVNVKVSKSSLFASESFFTINTGGGEESWNRDKPEVIYVNMDGTTVRAYYGKPSCTVTVKLNP